MTGWLHPAPYGWENQLASALSEDIGAGDLSSGCLPAEFSIKGMIEAQAEGVICGVGIAAACLSQVGRVTVHIADGNPVRPNDLVLSFEGDAASILSHERVSLNFLMFLSGVSTLTAAFVRKVAGTRASIVDTRKTVPGLRTLQKYAVRCGGGRNHRMGLYDAVMIKDNHIRASGSITQAIELARTHSPHTSKIEVEADRPDQADEAVHAGANIVLLDNMTPAQMSEIVQRHEGSQVLFEASGGVNLKTVRAIAESGVHLISVGALTHSAPALPLHLELD